MKLKSFRTDSNDLFDIDNLINNNSFTLDDVEQRFNILYNNWSEEDMLAHDYIQSIFEKYPDYNTEIDEGR